MNKISLKSSPFFEASPGCCWCVDHPTSQNSLHKRFQELVKCPYESYSQKTQVLKELRTKVLDLPWQSQ